MSARLKLPVSAKLFLIPWGLVSAWAFQVWFFRIYDRGFRYNPHILEFEFGWSQVLLLVFGVTGILFYERSRAVLPGWSRAAYLILITAAAAVLVLDLIIAQFVTPSWTAFALFWTAGVEWGTFKAEGAGFVWWFPLFGVPFILIGFGMLLSPLWAYREALRTVYVITNRRAIAFDGGRTTTIRSYPPDRLQGVHRKEKKDGSGDVIIARRAWRDGDRQSEELGFLRVRDPKAVESLIRKLAEQAAEPNEREHGQAR